VHEGIAMNDTPKKIEPVHLFWNGEMPMDAPIDIAWKHLINYPSWQNYPTVRRISGPEGGEGELVALQKEEKGFEFPPYYARTLKLDPPNRVVWKTYPEPGTQEAEFFGIIDFRLVESGGKTIFVYNNMYEFLVPYDDECELAEFKCKQYANFDALFAATRPKLKALVEGDVERC
jgi:hypothetical protein